MSQYDGLDARIVAAIREKRSPLYSRVVTEEAIRLADLTGRVAFRVTDGRIQALRRAGIIAYTGGVWRVVEK